MTAIEISAAQSASRPGAGSCSPCSQSTYILFVHSHNAVEAVEVCCRELPGTVCEVVAMSFAMPSHTRVGQVAHMPPTNSGGIDLKQMPHPIQLYNVSHNALSRRRPTDVSETDEEDFFVYHFLMVHF